MTKKSDRIVKKRTSASIITITQFKRFECLLNLYELIKIQTYKNIIEWVIVEGSKNKDDADKNKNNIKIIIDKEKNFKIIYVEYSGVCLSDLRNKGNTTCTGDIIVCMDDDDYYPCERVEHAVESLEKSNCQIAGCTDIYMYEYLMGKLYKFKGFHQNHSTNNCFAFKKTYLLNHKHESGLIMAEEKSFTNDFTSPMVQLISKKCIIVSSHDSNTFNKRELCVGGTIGVNQSLCEVNDHAITTYIPNNFFNKMNSLFYIEEESKYDIVYLMGGLNTKWDPKDDALGGSEQAVVKLCESWIQLNKKVAVYGDFNNKLDIFIHNNVEYKNWKLFEFNHTFKTVILWRTYGVYCFLPFNIKAKQIYIDYHDNFQEQEQLFIIYKKYSDKITKILFKSDFHKCEFEKILGYKVNKYLIIPNGIKINDFSNNWDKVSRDPYRFCYVSYYTRGLEQILKHIWITIKKLEPRAELHLYYGLDMFQDEKLVEYYKMLIGCTPGVIDHGRQTTKFIVREKYLSSFQLYITNTPSEIDCISIRESLITGCIPLISNYGVFSCREGIHFDLIDNNIESLENIGKAIVKLTKNNDQLNHFRKIFKKSDTIVDWKTNAEKLLLEFN